MAFRVPAPVAVRGPDVYALAKFLLMQARVSHDVVHDDVPTAEGPEVNGLIAGSVHEQAVDKVMRDAVGHDALLPALDAEALKPPPGRAVQVEGVAAGDALALKDRFPAPAQRDRPGSGT